MLIGYFDHNCLIFATMISFLFSFAAARFDAFGVELNPFQFLATEMQIHGQATR